MEIHKRLGVPIPEAAKSDWLTDSIIQIYVLTSRARRYVDGVALPLAVADVSSVLEHYPCKLDRWLIDEIVFEIDRLEREEKA